MIRIAHQKYILPVHHVAGNHSGPGMPASIDGASFIVHVSGLLQAGL